jgi:multicomponent K+:H+ antiporter subunit E
VSRLPPRAALAVALFATWIALNGASAAHVALGAVLAAGLPHALRRLAPPLPRAIRVVPALRLLGRVLIDIVIANMRVARLVLGPIAPLRPVFLTVPLDTAHPAVATLLARIVTLTPGTTTLGMDVEGRALLVHALHEEDPAGQVAAIKSRYEKPLMEIFGC